MYLIRRISDGVYAVMGGNKTAYTRNIDKVKGFIKIYMILMLGMFFVRGNVVAKTNEYKRALSVVGSSTTDISMIIGGIAQIIPGSTTCTMSKEQVLKQERQRIEIARKNYKPYECNLFKVGDKVTYGFYYMIFERTDFVGVVTKIEPKPTNEYVHLITVRRLSGKGESGTYSEQFLQLLKTGDGK